MDEGISTRGVPRSLLESVKANQPTHKNFSTPSHKSSLDFEVHATQRPILSLAEIQFHLQA